MSTVLYPLAGFAGVGRLYFYAVWRSANLFAAGGAGAAAGLTVARYCIHSAAPWRWPAATARCRCCSWRSACWPPARWCCAAIGWRHDLPAQQPAAVPPWPGAGYRARGRHLGYHAAARGRRRVAHPPPHAGAGQNPGGAGTHRHHRRQPDTRHHARGARPLPCLHRHAVPVHFCRQLVLAAARCGAAHRASGDRRRAGAAGVSRGHLVRHPRGRGSGGICAVSLSPTR